MNQLAPKLSSYPKNYIKPSTLLCEVPPTDMSEKSMGQVKAKASNSICSKVSFFLLKVFIALKKGCIWLSQEMNRGCEIHNRMKTIMDERYKDVNHFHIR